MIAAFSIIPASIYTCAITLAWAVVLTPMTSVAQESMQRTLLDLGADFQVDDQGRIVEVDFSEREVDASRIPSFKGCTELTKCFALYSNVCDVLLPAIADCEKLESLVLYGSPVTDASLRVFRDHPGLSNVNLTGSKITDESVGVILTWRSLKRLEIADTKISNMGIATLREHLEGVEIFPYEDIDE